MNQIMHSYEGSFLGVQSGEGRRAVLAFQVQGSDGVVVTIPAGQLLHLAAQIDAMKTEQPELFSTRSRKD
jgi:hypothetical protein